MAERLEAEVALLREAWPAMTYRPDGQWVCIPDYPLPAGWSDTSATVAFQIPVGPAGTPPYAFYVDRNLTFDGRQPVNYSPNAAGTPFDGTWSVFSWAPETWTWAEDAARGANMASFAKSFADRFAEGV